MQTKEEDMTQDSLIKGLFSVLPPELGAKCIISLLLSTLTTWTNGHMQC
jgi:hypothetical protein